MALLTVAEAKTALNITAATYDAELQDYVDGAIAAVEFICGYSAATSVTDVIAVSGDAIALRQTPVISLTSVTGDLCGALTVSDLRVDANSGVVRAKASVSPIAPDTYTVVYSAGRATVPVAMKQAAKVIVKHQWSTQRAPAARQPVNTDATFVPGLGYAIPNAALQMLAPYDRGPAVG